MYLNLLDLKQAWSRYDIFAHLAKRLATPVLTDLTVEHESNIFHFYITLKNLRNFKKSLT